MSRGAAASNAFPSNAFPSNAFPALPSCGAGHALSSPLGSAAAASALANPGCIGAGLTSTSPFVASPLASPALAPAVAHGRAAPGSPYSGGMMQSKRRLSGTTAEAGSGNKYQRAL